MQGVGRGQQAVDSFLPAASQHTKKTISSIRGKREELISETARPQREIHGRNIQVLSVTGEAAERSEQVR